MWCLIYICWNISPLPHFWTSSENKWSPPKTMRIQGWLLPSASNRFLNIFLTSTQTFVSLHYWCTVLSILTSAVITCTHGAWKHQRVMVLGRVTSQLVLSVIALLWLAVWTACGSEVVVTERMSKVMNWTRCQTPLFPLEEQMAAPQCTRQGDAATRRSKQGVKTHTNTDTLTLLSCVYCTH